PAPVPGLAPEALHIAADIVARAGFPPASYCLLDSASNSPYNPYVHSSTGGGGKPIPGGGDAGPPVEISQLSPLIRALASRPSAGGVRKPLPVPVAAVPPVETSQPAPLLRALARQRIAAVNLYVPEDCRPAVRAAVHSLVSE